MSAVQLIGVAASLSLLAGWRLYACVLATGLAMHFGWLHPPTQVHALAVLDNPWVMGVAALGTAVEFFADKIPWLDSLWDGVHTLIRPMGGAALLSHTAKAGTRAVANVSPEPFSNLALSSTEDVVSTGGLLLVLPHPAVAIVVALMLLVVVIAALVLAWRIIGGLRRILARRSKAPDATAGGVL